MKTPHEMTAAECADWLFAQLPDDERFFFGNRNQPRMAINVYPLTLDGAVEALQMPMRILEWYFNDTENKWVVRAYPAQRVTIGGPIKFCYEVSGPDEITARYRLAVACRQPLKEWTA